MPRYRKPDDHPDPTDPRKITKFESLEGKVLRDASGAPLNIIGRTGLSGRGMLNKWGANFAADPLVTRYNPRTGKLEVLLVERADTSQWALPGGKVDPGEQPWETAGRELVEESGIRGVDLSFQGARKVYAGYIDDSRNTDNAWMESTVFHLHLGKVAAAKVTLRAGSDAKDAAWKSAIHPPRLHAGQSQYVHLAVADMEPSL
jgi:ADP-ribose pyrophosphatase